MITKIYANGKDEFEFFKELEARNGETDKKIVITSYSIHYTKLYDIC